MWQYLLRLRPRARASEEDRAREQAAEGWQMWRAGHGPWVNINGRRVKRWSLRRWDEEPRQVGGPLGAVGLAYRQGAIR